MNPYKNCRSLLLLSILGFSMNTNAARQGPFLKVADSSNFGYTYGYAPSMVWDNGTYYSWYGSTGNGTANDWDRVRLVTSANGVNWSAPSMLIQSSGGSSERAACDPSVVYYNGYWYCFYSGNRVNVQTVHFVARSVNPGGPYLKYTNRGTWEASPSDPKVIISPFVATPENSGWYGSGQASVVVYNNKLYMWHTDTTSQYPNAQVNKIYMRTSYDAVNWTAAQLTSLGTSSIDVQYNPFTKTFIAYEISTGHSQSAFSQRWFSRDGINWNGGANGLAQPNWAHNMGALRDRYGHTTLNNSTILGFGAPYDLNPVQTWPQWDVYSHRWTDPQYVKGDFDGDGKQDPAIVNAATGRWYIKSSLTGQNGTPAIPWGWQWGGMLPVHHLACGDYDGDGKTDLAIIDYNTPGGASWYVISSLYGAGNCPGIPWGWQFPGMVRQHELALGDWDGDGKTDRAIVDRESAGGAKWYIIRSSDGGGGVPGIPWDWQWGGMTKAHTMVLEDYDGDNKMDRAIVDPHHPNGMAWYVICSSTGGQPPFIPWGWNFGASMHVPIPADYNGDNKADAAVVIPAHGTNNKWYGHSSINGQPLTEFPYGWAWGGMFDWHQPVVGDYDGDGKADRAIMDPDLGSGAAWYILGSSNGQAPAWHPYGTLMLPAY